MKKDFRVQYPLWQMVFIVLFGIMAFSMTDMSTELVNTADKVSFGIEIPGLKSILLFGVMIITFILIAIFASKISKHNKQHPDQKLSMWQIRPLEYLEQDEGMTHITRRAAQKVYTFFVWALPLLAIVIMIFELSKFLVITGILVLALMQYLIYYLEIRKHLEEDDE